MLEKLNWEHVCEQSISEHKTGKQEKKFAMVSNIPVLFTNQALRSFRNQPMQHPKKKDENQWNQLVDIQSVAEDYK